MQQARLVGAQAAPRGGAVARAGFRIEFGEEGADLGLHRGLHRAHHLRSGQEALAGNAVGEDDVVAVEEQVHILDGAALDHLHGAAIDQVLRRDQHLGFAEQQFGRRIAHQHPVLRRDQQWPRRAMGPGLEPDRGEAAFGRHRAPPDPAQRLRPGVLGQHQIARHQRLDRARPRGGGNAAAGDEAGHDMQGDKAHVRVPVGTRHLVGEVDGFLLGVGMDRQRAVGIQRHALARGELHGVARLHRNAVDLGDRQRARGAVHVVAEHVDRLVAPRFDRRLVIDGDQHCLDRIPRDQQVRIVIRIARVGDADADRIQRADVHREGQRHRHGEAVHLGVVGVVGVRDVEVLVVGAVDIVDRGGRGREVHLDRRAVHPHADHVVVDRVHVFRVFVRGEGEADRHQIAGRHEVDVKPGGVIGAGAGKRVEACIVVDAGGVGRGIGRGVRVRREPAATVGEIRGIAGRQDYPGVGRRRLGRDRIALGVDRRGVLRAGIGGIDHRHAVAKDRLRHLHCSGGGVVAQLCRSCHAVPANVGGSANAAPETCVRPWCRAVSASVSWGRFGPARCPASGHNYCAQPKPDSRHEKTFFFQGARGGAPGVCGATVPPRLCSHPAGAKPDAP
ncbi:hypothetical protein SDC9_34792 [bioreactor metagenome]|uniref:Uncharacterized protein n=1 Tax=bioreactor metagenome TaxID=1076179 RepID=A0A644VCC3_9ZZZZ